jgi:hypothetical protein
MSDDLGLPDHGYGDDPFDGSGYDTDPYQNDGTHDGYYGNHPDPYEDPVTVAHDDDTAAVGGRGEIDQAGKININFGDAGGDAASGW